VKRLCRCGHPKADHTGRLTNGEGWKTLSTTACLAGTKVAGAGTWYAERVGGDRCKEWQFSLRQTLRNPIYSPATRDGA
jgi:hypothetical protein